jgi:two-component system, LuxR family, sensor kinase FixL
MRGATFPLAGGYLLLYVALDWISYFHPMAGLDITPWNPHAGLAVGLLAWRPGAWWVVWLGALCTALAPPGTSLPVEAALLSSAAIAAVHAATAWAVGRWLGARPMLVTRRHCAIFLSIVVAGALAGALLHAAVLAALDVIELQRIPAAVHRAWIGDTVGLLVTLPLIFVLAVAERRRASVAMLRKVEWWLMVAAAGVATWAVFARPAEDQFKFFYLLFLPVVWAAARFGVTGAVWSAMLVQGLLAASVQSAPYRPLTVFELQLLMAVLAATGLLLGTIVDEREEAERNLRASQRLAAAGDMAAALAHELNQPLAAITTYARASQLLAQRLGEADRRHGPPLSEVADKLVAEAGRASDVVKRLRNFFRHRATELEPADMRQLFDEVLSPQAGHAQALGVGLQWTCEPALPPIWLDRVQITVVLRNLVTNAIEAVTPLAAQKGAASVSVTAVADGKSVVVQVADSGPGVDAVEVGQLFEGRRSSKPGGMGVGLGICRSIVEAHGGTIWAEPGPGGKFLFCLPTGSGVANE